MCNDFVCRWLPWCDEPCYSPDECMRVVSYQLVSGAVSCHELCCVCKNATFVILNSIPYAVCAVCRKK